ncbi:MAG: glycosyltransferase [Deltaproteobacteria bacterium]|nr:glycosyltransferase [Deltaproteobacteria bacterium]
MERVVRIQSRICVGGPALHTILLSEGLSASRGSRYETTLVGGALEPGEASLEGLARERAVDVELIPEMRRSLSPRHDTVALAKLVRLLRRLRPTIVHTHTAKAGAIGRVAARIARVPLVFHTFHGHVFDGYFTGGRSRAFLAAERNLGRLTDRIIAISPAQREDLAFKYQVAPIEKIELVPLGLELDRFRRIDLDGRGALRRELALSPDAPLVLSVGRLVPIKRFDLLIDAFGRVSAVRPDAALVIAGDGEPSFRAELEARARRVSGRIFFLGWRRDLERLYRDADVFALTSDNEGTPVAVIEAVSAGLPVVATDVGGLRDILEPEMGRRVGRGDSMALAQALLTALDPPVGRVPEPVRDRMVTTFSHRRLISDVSRLYDRLLEERLRRPHPALGPEPREGTLC